MRLTAAQRTERARHTAAADHLERIAAAATKAAEDLCLLFGDELDALDDDEADPLRCVVNPLHDVATAAEARAQQRRSESLRVGWTYQDHAFAALVAQNID